MFTVLSGLASSPSPLNSFIEQLFLLPEKISSKYFDVRNIYFSCKNIVYKHVLNIAKSIACITNLLIAIYNNNNNWMGWYVICTFHTIMGKYFTLPKKNVTMVICTPSMETIYLYTYDNTYGIKDYLSIRKNIIFFMHFLYHFLFNINILVWIPGLFK